MMLAPAGWSRPPMALGPDPHGTWPGRHPVIDGISRVVGFGMMPGGCEGHAG